MRRRDDVQESVAIAERGHGRGVDKRREPKSERLTWKASLDDESLQALRALRDKVLPTI